MIVDDERFMAYLKRLISVRSVKGAAEENAPFGKGVTDALRYFLSIAEEMGFETVNYDDRFGEVIWRAEGENAGEFGIIGHIDVVPEGKGWNTDPFTLTEKDGRLYARGIQDDKGPLLTCLYVLSQLKERKIKPRNTARLYVGCDEESGWADVDYFLTKSAFCAEGFSPDGNFPVIYAEKGLNTLTFEYPLKSGLFTEISGGTVFNAVCNYASAKGRVNAETLEKYGLKCECGKIESFGKSAHASRPEQGNNAILPLLRYMNDCGEDLTLLIDVLFNDSLGVKKIGNETGMATLSPDIIRQKGATLEIVCDFRVPARMTLEDFLPLFDGCGIKYTPLKLRNPHFVDKESGIIKTLVKCYESVTGEKAEPVSQGGGTFASVFKRGAAFGPEFENSLSSIHEPDESASAEDMDRAYRIYYKTIEELLLRSAE